MMCLKSYIEIYLFEIYVTKVSIYHPLVRGFSADLKGSCLALI